ncbi:MAG: energy transducer TonB [Wenzhouxiangellaceae bacterium]|nr:energy transducer TonB [Wenzhouxiangellaceae bacterium]
MPIGLIVGLVLVAACAAPEPQTQPTYRSPVIEISPNNLGQYWVVDKSTVSRPPSRFRPGGPCQMVKLAYTIDSQGQVFDIEVIDSFPNESFVPTAKRILRARQFKPGEDNPERIPVRTVSTELLQLSSAGCGHLRRRQQG